MRLLLFNSTNFLLQVNTNSNNNNTKRSILIVVSAFSTVLASRGDRGVRSNKTFLKRRINGEVACQESNITTNICTRSAIYHTPYLRVQNNIPWNVVLVRIGTTYIHNTCIQAYAPYPHTPESIIIIIIKMKCFLRRN